MMFARQLLFAGLLVGLSIPIQTTQAKDEALATKILQLNHTHGRTIEIAIEALQLGVSVASIGDSTVILRGSAADIGTVSALIEQLDIPSSSQEARLRTVFLPISTRPSKNLIVLLQTVVSGPQSEIAFDATSRMVVVRATDGEIQALRQLLAQIDRPAQSLTLQFFFIRANIGTEGENKLPAALRRIEKSLSENGFTELSLMAPITVAAEENQHFISHAGVRNEDETSPRMEDLSLTIEGVARLQPQSKLVQLTLEAHVRGTYRRALDSPAAAAFAIETTISMKLGSYVILAATPASTASGDAVALVVRVTAGLEPSGTE